MTNRDVGSTTAVSVGQDEQSQLQSKMQDAARETGETAQQLGEKVRQTGQQQANQQKQRAAEGLGTIAEALRQASDKAGKQHQPGVEQITRVSAEQAERLSQYLRDADVNQMIGQAQDFARRQPAIFLAGAFAVGLLGSRLVKAGGVMDGSRQGREPGQQRYGYGRYGYQQSYAAGRGEAGAVGDEWPEPVAQVPGYDPTVQRRETGI